MRSLVGGLLLVGTLCSGVAADWVRNPTNQHYYRHVKVVLDAAHPLYWEDAKSQAEAAGGYLVTITSQEENDMDPHTLNYSVDYASGYIVESLAAPGDANGDGTVDGADLNTVLSNYNQSTGATATVPEPAALVLLGIGAVVFAGCQAAASWRRSRNTLGVLWRGRPGCTVQARRLHHNFGQHLVKTALPHTSI
jgi:hypothetical protein